MRLLSILAISTILSFSSAIAAGSSEGPSMGDVKSLVANGNYAGAIVALNKLAKTKPTADVYNMLGFSNRKLGNMSAAASNYVKALSINPNHKGALEYQGEMFVKLKQIGKAKANLAKLVKLCPQGCEEREDLEKALSGK